MVLLRATDCSDAVASAPASAPAQSRPAILIFWVLGGER